MNKGKKIGKGRTRLVRVRKPHHDLLKDAADVRGRTILEELREILDRHFRGKRSM